MKRRGDHELSYYATPGPSTDLSRYGLLVEMLPSDPNSLSEIIRGVILHNWTAMTTGVELTPERNGMSIMGAAPVVDRILEIDQDSIEVARPPGRRMIGFCYHFALLHCALLRAKDVASRPRCGFANYLDDGKWIDHWIVEYWTGDQWQLHDPQIGMDVTGQDFHDGVAAWQLCRTGQADPTLHGNGELWAWDELRGSLVNDMGALNKVDVGNWDWCDLLRVEPLDQPHAAVDFQLDDLAAIASHNRDFAELRAAFRDCTSIRPPDDIIQR